MTFKMLPGEVADLLPKWEGGRCAPVQSLTVDGRGAALEVRGPTEALALFD